MDNNGGTQQLSRVARIEEKIDKQAISDTAISSTSGGMSFRNMLEVMEFSKLMAVSDVAVPRHLRGNVGACLAVCIQAVEWRMSPYAVANKSYVVNDRISYESQLIHAVIEQRAPLVGRLRCSYRGEGDARRCKVWATLKGETAPFEYESPPFRDIQPKNSPLWKTKPDLQLFYNTSRDWGRMYVPDVILGVYAEDELETSLVASRQTVPMPRAIGESSVANLPDPKPAVDPDAHEQPPLEESQLPEQKPQMTQEDYDRLAREKAEANKKSNPVSEPSETAISAAEQNEIQCSELAASLEIPREQYQSGFNRFLLAKRKKDKPGLLSAAEWDELKRAIKGKAGYFAAV